MIYVSLILFAIAAVIGISLAVPHARRKPVGIGHALSHGIFAAAGLVLLIVLLAAKGSAPLSLVSLILFIVAALGGFLLFGLHLRKRALPVPIIVIHALIAVGGFVLLLMAAFG